MTQRSAKASFLALLVSLWLAPTCLRAQAPPGPITAPSRDLPPAKPRASTTKSNQPQVAPRTSLAGAWQFNRADSDDPRQVVRAAERKPADNFPNGGNGGTSPGGGYPGGGYPGGGYPGGGYPGGPFPGQGQGGNGPRRTSGNDIEDNPKIQPLLRPSGSLTIELKDPEVDVSDEQSNMLVFFTDGRQLQKSQYGNRQEIAARWNGARLESEEKSPLGGKMSRTYELAPDGRKLYETVNIDNGKKTPIVIRYVYDIAGAVETGVEDSDPDRPVLKRTPSDNASQPQ